ncbi:MAG: glycosyltransferase [Acidobacteria bacterium]|uniref:Glycosyltransferase n=1 Tax=Candidatus Polarisedimenticola svalbardensis TaxID=2886004 RepID=A0A8J6XV21_9BACT|nr:glycosyltransferase [Candidatus Polarisedimenticola svalbardensis]
MSLEILYVGARSGTCLQRAGGLEDLGHRITFIDSGVPEINTGWYTIYRAVHQVRRYPDLFRASSRIVKAVSRRPYDLLWIDKGLMIAPGALSRAREIRPEMKMVAYSPDDMMNPGNQTRRYLARLPLHDLVVTTKSYNVPELTDLGARNVFFVGNAYDPELHRPMKLSPQEQDRFGSEVGFVGAYEEDRADSMIHAAKAGIPITVHGPGWEHCRDRHPNLRIGESFLRGADYTRAVVGSRINLGFLRKVNRDLQTTRSIEIPASGAFMLAERTDEHLELFREGVEAEFFDSDDEMIDKCRYYLANEQKRQAVAGAGLARCRESGYSNQDRLAAILKKLGTAG